MNAATIASVITVYGVVFLSLLALYVEKGERPFRRTRLGFRRLPVWEKTFLAFFVGAWIAFASVKEGTNGVSQVEDDTNTVSGLLMMGFFGRPNLAPGMTPSITDEDIARMWRISSTTDVGALAAPTVNAVTNAAWCDYGGMSDAMRIKPVGWCFLYGDKATVGLTVFQNGDFRPNVKTHFFPRPFDANLSLLPRLNWRLLPDGGESVFWHEHTPSNSLLLTWNNALYNREASCPTNFQAELFPDGRFDYRYPDSTVRYVPVFPFDWDGDGLENSVDPNPQTANPIDAHGTNDEWRRIVCSNVFESVGGAVSFRGDVNTNAYYFVEVCVERGPAPIYFNADRTSRLGSPVIVANGGETNHVPLLIGVEYVVTSTVPISVEFCDDGFTQVTQNDERTYVVKWPLDVVFTEEYSNSNRTYSVSFMPFDPGGEFDWGGSSEGGRIPLAASPQTQTSCACHFGYGRMVTFFCSPTCNCGGECVATGAYSFESAVFAVTGGVCRCGFDDSHPNEDSPGEPTDDAAFSINFSKSVVIYEDEHINSRGEYMEKRSSRVRLTISANGGQNGAFITIWQQNADKLASVGGTVPVPIVRTLAPHESVFETCDFEGVAPSTDGGDVVFSGCLIDQSTMDRLDDSSSLTVVELRVEADADYPLEKRRHVFGPAETVMIKSVPQGMAVISGTVPDDANFSTSATPANLMVGENVNAFSLVATVDTESFCIPLAVIHPDNHLEIVEVLPLILSDWAILNASPLSPGTAGAAGKIKLRLTPSHVSFGKLSLIEGYAPPSGVWGCCLDEVLYPHDKISHGSDAGGAETFHEKGTEVHDDNTLDFDRVAFWANPNQLFPCQGGGFTWNIPWKWYAENSVSIHDWMVVPQVITIGSNGTVSISKNGVVITREIGGSQSWHESE